MKLPRKGTRIHYDPTPGIQNPNRWSGQYRGCVDGQLIVRVWFPHKQRWSYQLYSRWWWDEGHFRVGPLPRLKLMSA